MEFFENLKPQNVAKIIDSKHDFSPLYTTNLPE